MPRCRIATPWTFCSAKWPKTARSCGSSVAATAFPQKATDRSDRRKDSTGRSLILLGKTIPPICPSLTVGKKAMGMQRVILSSHRHQPQMVLYRTTILGPVSISPNSCVERAPDDETEEWPDIFPPNAGKD